MGCTPGEPKKPESTPLVKVNDQVISVDDFRAEIDAMTNDEKIAYSTPAAKQNLLQTIISMELLHQEGVRQGIDRDPVIEATMNRERRKLVINHMLQGNISMAEVLSYFQDNYVLVRHIVLRFTPQMTDTEKEKKKQALESVRTRILEGEDFLEMSRQYSQDSNAHTGGELPYISRYDHRLTGFTETAFALQEPMDISEVIVTEAGVHIIQLLEKPGNLDPRGLTPEMQDEILQLIGQDRYKTYITELYPQADIQINHDALSQIGLGMAPAAAPQAPVTPPSAPAAQTPATESPAPDSPEPTSPTVDQ